MKNKRIVISLSLLFTVSALTAWIVNNPTFLSSTSSAASQTFSISNSVLTPSATAADPLPRYEVFFFTGDGNYELSQFAGDASVGTPVWNYNYTYPTAGTYASFVETTDVYDDGEDPPGIASASRTVAGSGVFPPNKNLGGYTAKITPVRKMVHEHPLTYIVTFENPTESRCENISGYVEFKYDASKLSYTGPVTYPLCETQALQTAGTIHIPFTNLPRGKQRNAFLKFTTTGTAGQVVAPPTARLVNVDPNCNVSAESFVLGAHCVVETAHDPNHKEMYLDYRNGQNYLVLKIDFQNDGPDFAQNISIEDELDIKLQGCPMSQANLADFYPVGKGVPQLTKLSPGKFKIDWQGISLPGLAQEGYGTQFFEQDTKGYVKIEISIPKQNCFSPILPCDAFLNRAAIRFNYNPPLETNLAVLGMGCAVPIGPAPSPAISSLILPTSCSDTLVSDTIIVVAANAANVPLLSQGWIDFFNGFHCQWYPVSGVQNANSAAATLSTVRNQTYTMVASKACKRYIVHRRIEVPCSLQISDVITSSGGLYNIALTATGGNGSPLEWQDGTPGSAWSKSSVMPGKFYFSVYQPSTGCYDEKWVTLCGNEPVVTDAPGDCKADLQITAGTPPYTFQWEWNGSPQTFSGSIVDLAGKNNPRVTVTDGKGCSTVFTPVKSNCRLIRFDDWSVIGAVVGVFLSAIAGFIWFNWRRRR